jgi:hypothetical protein
MLKLEGYSLFEGWELYGIENYNKKIETIYLDNITGDVFIDINNKYIKKGIFGQQYGKPYIYMDNCNYMRILNKYNVIVKNSSIAKQLNTEYKLNCSIDK